MDALSTVEAWNVAVASLPLSTLSKLCEKKWWNLWMLVWRRPRVSFTRSTMAIYCCLWLNTLHPRLRKTGVSSPGHCERAQERSVAIKYLTTDEMKSCLGKLQLYRELRLYRFQFFFHELNICKRDGRDVYFRVFEFSSFQVRLVAQSEKRKASNLFLVSIEKRKLLWYPLNGHPIFSIWELFST